MPDKKFRVAVALDKEMAACILGGDTIDFLHTFAETNPLDELPDQMTIEFMEKILPGADACLTCWGTPGFTDELIDANPKLRLIAHAAGSVKHHITKNFWDRMRISSNAAIIAKDVAQTVLAYIQFTITGLWVFAQNTRAGEWTGGEAAKFKTRKLDCCTVGVVGASHVGREVIRLLKPYNCKVNLYDPLISDFEIEALGVTIVRDLNELIKTSDVLTLHAPAIESTRHMINKDNAPLIKNGALFINTARGMLVDEEALVKELETGRFFACIDVTDPEPPSAGHPFRKLKNVILTPHIAGGYSTDARRMLGKNSVNEIFNYLHKGVLNFEVRREMMGTIA